MREILLAGLTTQRPSRFHNTLGNPHLHHFFLAEADCVSEKEACAAWFTGGFYGRPVEIRRACHCPGAHPLRRPGRRLAPVARTLQCIKLADGSLVYSEPMPGYHFWASPAATADGLLYFATAGTSYVIKAGPKFEVVAKNDLGDMHFASAAVSDGKIFLRGNKFLFCIGRK